MIIVMKPEASEKDVEHIVEKLKEVGLEAHISKGKYRTIIGVIGDEELIANLPLTAYPGVEKVMPVLKPYKLVSREFQPEDTVLEIRGSKIGGGHFGLMAGPCSVETAEQTLSTAKFVRKCGANFLRGGAYKPRTSPYSFQGLGEEGLKILAEAREETGLPVVTEVMDVRDVELVSRYADVLQIGARNMQNFLLLTEVGKQDKPVLIKRGFSNTIEEWLMAAEYVAKAGNKKIILCERGIRTFETSTRNTLDVSSIPIVKSLSHLPVIADPSHASGRSDLILPLSLASIAAGADGLLIEVHPNPEEALCDGPQSLNFENFSQLAEKIKEILPYFSRTL